MFYCPRHRSRRDTYEFPKFMGGMRGKLCKSCLHDLNKYPVDHHEQLRWNNAGFQKETAKQTEQRKEMLEFDKQFLPR